MNENHVYLAPFFGSMGATAAIVMSGIGWYFLNDE